VSPRRRDLQRPLGVRLPFHVREVHVVPGAIGEQRGQIDVGLGQLTPGVQVVRDLGQGSRAEHPDPRHHARFGDVLPWQHQGVEARRARRERDRQGAPDRRGRGSR